MSPAFTQLSPIDTQSLNWIFYYTLHACHRRYYSNSIYSGACNGNDQLAIFIIEPNEDESAIYNIEEVSSQRYFVLQDILCSLNWISMFDEIILDASSASWKSKFSHSRGDHRTLSEKSRYANDAGKRSDRKTWLRKKEPFRWRFYSAINTELSPNPFFLAKSRAAHQRSMRLLSPAQAISLPPACNNMRYFIE